MVTPPRLIAGRFELGELLGQGAMGQVWRARDRDLDRDVALKLIRSFEGVRVERFRREAELAARLQHPGIVRVHAAGEEHGLPWIALELVEGARSLQAAAQRMPLAGRLRLLRDAAAALGHAHARGVVHRDVKSENVLIDRDGRARVTDFGIATAADLERLTRSGALVGTPTALAPEQVEGQPVSPATDVWGLGVLLYLTLTGRPPFEAPSFMDLIGQVLAAAPPPPRRLAPDTPPAVEAVCLRALARDPRDRYPDGAAMAAALDEALAAGAARPTARVRPALAIALASASALVALVLAARASRSPTSPQPEPLRATAPPPAQPTPPVEGATTPSWLRVGAQRALHLERTMTLGGVGPTGYISLELLERIEGLAGDQVDVSYDLTRLRARSVAGSYDSHREDAHTVTSQETLRVLRRAATRRLVGRFSLTTGQFSRLTGDPPLPMQEVPLYGVPGFGVVQCAHDDGVQASLDSVHGLFLPAPLPGTALRRPFTLWLPGGVGHRLEVEIRSSDDGLEARGAGPTTRVEAERVEAELIEVTSMEVTGSGVVRDGRLVEAAVSVSTGMGNAFELRYQSQERGPEGR